MTFKIIENADSLLMSLQSGAIDLCAHLTSTQTAQLGEDRVNNGLFMLFAPFDDPEIAVAIVVEHARSGSALTSIAADVLDAYFSIQASAASSTAENESGLLR